MSALNDEAVGVSIMTAAGSPTGSKTRQTIKERQAGSGHGNAAGGGRSAAKKASPDKAAAVKTGALSPSTKWAGTQDGAAEAVAGAAKGKFGSFQLWEEPYKTDVQGRGRAGTFKGKGPAGSGSLLVRNFNAAESTINLDNNHYGYAFGNSELAGERK
jgi:hypothetical protein